MPWWTPTGCLPTECIARNAMSMPALGVNVVSIGASILMSSFSSKNKKETSHRTDSAVSHATVVRDTTRAATCALAWALAGVNSFHWGELGLRCLRQCVAACMLPATCALAWRIRWCARTQGEHLPNRTLGLWHNKVGDAGATALAEAVKATVLTSVQ